MPGKASETDLEQYENYRFHIANSRTYQVAAIAHFFFILIFYYLKVLPLVFFNIFSVFILVLAYKLCTSNQEKMAAILAISEIILHAAIATYYVGWETGYFYYLLGIIPLVSYNPETTKTQKALQHIMVAFIFIAIKYYTDTHAAIYPLDPTITRLLYYSNGFTFAVLLGLISYYYSFTAKASENKILQQQQKADFENRSKSIFLANMSHELRTPLNAIIGYSELLYENEKEQGHTQTIKDLKKITRAGNHLLALINNILDLSKIESGKIELEYQFINISKLIDDIAININPIAKTTNNALTINIDKNIGQVCIEATRIRQIIINLLSNACKFTQNGEISLSIIAHEGKEPSISFIVSDTGIGITREKIPKLFKPFSQIETSTTRLYGGTGLGLTISKHFIELMKGTISVSSEPNAGTTFTVVLPIDAENCTVNNS